MRKLFNRLAGPQKTVVQTLSLVVFMGGLAWAAVPFYDWFCRGTGFGAFARGRSSLRQGPLNAR